MKKFLLLALVVSMLGCERDPEIARVTKEYEIMAVDPPKHFTVDVRDVLSNERYNGQYVSKYCSNWDKLKVGSIWVFEEVTFGVTTVCM